MISSQQGSNMQVHLVCVLAMTEPVKPVGEGHLASITESGLYLPLT